MTKEEFQQLKSHIVVTAAYFNQELRDEVVQMYASDLADLQYDQVVTAINNLRRDPATRSFPLPASIRARVEAKESPQDAARLASAEIWKAIGRCGWPNPERARAMIGDLGWEVVKHMGGWAQVCQDANEDSNLLPRMRDIAESIHRRASAGKLNEKISLPEPDSTKVQKLVGDTLRQLPGGS